MSAAPAITLRPADYSCWKKIHIVGDIHGCFTVLREALPEIRDDELYIFVGDYLDRGLENAAVLNFMLGIRDRKNCHFIEGNHEETLRSYAEDAKVTSSEFLSRTRGEIDGIDRKEIRMFCRRLRQCDYFTCFGKTFLVCHGGIPNLPPLGLPGVAARDLVYGVGSYDDSDRIADSWTRTQPADFIQVFGHRSSKNAPVRLSDNVYCLEGKVEYGGNLRLLEISEDGIIPREFKNEVFDPARSMDVPELVEELRKNRYIIEKNFGSVSSFNFTSQAFERKIWNEQTITARGLYVDVGTGAVVARGYRKFFNLEERPETGFDVLKGSLKFPLRAYRKENGFLGLISLYNGELFITTKSNPEAEYAGFFRELLFEKCRDPEALREYLSKNPVTLVTECIDIVRDPHIIRYPESRVVLLDIVENTLEFSHRSYEELTAVGERIGLPVKKLSFVIGSPEEFGDWYNRERQETMDPLAEHTEGYVIEDAAGYMVKIKLPFYTFWKKMRAAAGVVLRQEKLPGRLNKKGERFIKWVSEKIRGGLNHISIIELREEYVKETGDRMTD